MGVYVSNAEGESIALLRCSDCDTEYETDETMANDCPECGCQTFDIKSTERGTPWR